jgi:hypothetical protein
MILEQWFKLLKLAFPNNKKKGEKVAKVINIKDFLDPKRDVKKLLTEPQKLNKCLVAERDELANFDISAPLCVLCDKEFTDNEQIFVEETLDESSEASVFLAYHRECFMSHLYDPQPTMEDVGNMLVNAVYSPNVCELCERTFSENLPFTDGNAYYCEECANSIGNLQKTEDQD